MSSAAFRITTRQSGMTLVELMIALALSLVVLAASTAVMTSTSSTYRSEMDASEIQDSGRMVIELLTRLVRQTAYENWDPVNGSPVNSAAYEKIYFTKVSPAIMGADDTTVEKQDGPSFSSIKSGGVNGSDSIRLRYYGVNMPGNTGVGDGTVINCAGNATAAPDGIEDADEGRGTSILFVDLDTNGEPNLYCKYLGKTGKSWTAETLVRGVESFQILYGIDTGAQDSYPNTFMRADDINADPANANDMWRRVVAVKIALLMRTSQASGDAPAAQRFELFGPDYADSEDKGVLIDVAELPAKQRARARKVYSTTVFLRNEVSR